MADAVPVPPPPPTAPRTLPSEALLRRPDVPAAYARVEKQATEVGVARSERYPKFTLNLTDGVFASSYMGMPTLTYTDTALGLANKLYKGGATDFLDVLSAQEVYLRDAQALNESRRESVLAAVTLYRSLGGGWSRLP